MNRLGARRPREHRVAAVAAGRTEVLEGGRRIVGQLADERERLADVPQPVVGAGARLDDQRRVAVERGGEVVVRLVDAEEAVNGRRERLEVRHLRLAAMEGETLRGHQTMECRIQRPFFDAQGVIRDLLNARRKTVPVLRLATQHFQEQEIERALNGIRLLCRALHT